MIQCIWIVSGGVMVDIIGAMGFYNSHRKALIGHFVVMALVLKND